VDITEVSSREVKNNDGVRLAGIHKIAAVRENPYMFDIDQMPAFNQLKRHPFLL
jgi:hypothetical protein